MYVMSPLRFRLQVAGVLAVLVNVAECLIITSVLAGDRKFKTISFDTKFLKPLMFEKEMPLTEFRRHRTVRPPKFDIDINIPIKLPLEEEYSHEPYPKKPHESELFFQTSEISEPAYKKGGQYANNELAYAASAQQAQMQSAVAPAQPQQQPPNRLQMQQIKSTPMSLVQNAQQYVPQPTFDDRQSISRSMRPRSDAPSTSGGSLQMTPRQDVSPEARNSYNEPTYDGYKQGPEFVPGGFVNLQLSGPTGGPKTTYEDYDREKWAQQLSQTPGAMPYPILNYHQLQNFYGGLGTFTNGLAENRYAPLSIKDQVKMAINKMANSLYWGREH